MQYIRVPPKAEVVSSNLAGCAKITNATKNLDDSRLRENRPDSTDCWRNSSTEAVGGIPAARTADRTERDAEAKTPRRPKRPPPDADPITVGDDPKLRPRPPTAEEADCLTILPAHVRRGSINCQSTILCRNVRMDEHQFTCVKPAEPR